MLGLKMEKETMKSKSKFVNKVCKYCGELFKYRDMPWKRKQGNLGKYCGKLCSNRANAPELSKNRMGSGNPMYGKKSTRKGVPLSKETKKRLSESLLRTHTKKRADPNYVPRRGSKNPTPKTKATGAKNKSWFKSGESHWNYAKYGRIERALIARIRRLKEYKVWRKSILERDDHKCCVCGSIENLVVHHKKHFAEIILRNKLQTYEEARKCDELYDLGIGETLCRSCHYQTDTYGKTVRDIK